MLPGIFTWTSVCFLRWAHRHGFFFNWWIWTWGSSIRLIFSFRWGYLSRAGLWDKSHLMRQIEKYVNVLWQFLSLFYDLLIDLKFFFKHVRLLLIFFFSWNCRYADIYTSRVSNFLHYTPFMYFRAQEQVLNDNLKLWVFSNK